MRLPIRTTCWLCIVSSLALVVSGLTSPIRTPQTPNAQVYANLPSRSFALVSDGSSLAVTPAAPNRASVDADDSEFDEEEECESSCLFSRLVCPAFIPSDPPTKPLSRPCPGSSPPRTAAVPLRC